MSCLSIVKLLVVGVFLLVSLFTFPEFAHMAILTNLRAVKDLRYCSCLKHILPVSVVFFLNFRIWVRGKWTRSWLSAKAPLEINDFLRGTQLILTWQLIWLWQAFWYRHRPQESHCGRGPLLSEALKASPQSLLLSHLYAVFSSASFLLPISPLFEHKQLFLTVHLWGVRLMCMRCRYTSKGSTL